MRIYFLRICGTAMGNVALMLHRQGHTVMGADAAMYPPISTILKDAGIQVFEGYDPERLARLKPDCVVVGNAVSRGNPEIEWLLEARDIPYVSLPEFLKSSILKDRQNIVITGTHGKTTTTTMAAYLLKHNSRDPGYLIGGVPKDLASGAHWGSDNQFVIEGDEYDSAFFDKRSKFIHYQPHILGINAIEFDHADIFYDLRDVLRTFSHVTRIVPRNGYVVVNGDDVNIRQLPAISWAPVLKVGVGVQNEVRISGFYEAATHTEFELLYKEKLWARVRWQLSGLFNARNAAMAALCAGLAVYPEDLAKLDLSALGCFQGVQRRQDILYAKPECTVLEDFGHHPTALEMTLRSLRNRYPTHRITACFEPRSNTAQMPVFEEAFVQSLSVADSILLVPGTAASELNLRSMAQQLKSEDRMAAHFESHSALLDALHYQLRSITTRPHVVCYFTNGCFQGVQHALVANLTQST